MKRAVVLLSGGMDSSTLLKVLQKDQYEIRALGVHYGQRHAKELQAAKLIADWAGVPYDVVDLGVLKSVVLKNNSQTDDIDVPEGHYAEDNMKATVVPNRNMIMLSVATAYAISHDMNFVAYAAHAGDHAIYPDCREMFIEQLDKAMQLCHYTPIKLLAPFANRSKAEIAAIGFFDKVPFELTWSCYKGGEIHCGKCGTCVERREAFYLSGTTDPTVYEDNTPIQVLLGSK